MKISTLIAMAFRSLRRNLKRSILTMVGISIGIAAVITIVSIGEGYREKTIKDFTGSDDSSVTLVTNFMPNNQEVSINKPLFNDKDVVLIRMVPEVQKCEPVRTSFGSSSYLEGSIRNKKIRASAEGVIETKNVNILGRNLNKVDNDRLRNVAVIDASLLSDEVQSDPFAIPKVEKGIKYEKYLGAILTLGGKNYEVVGINLGAPESNTTASMFSMPSPIKVPKSINDKLGGEKGISSVKITLKPKVDVSKAIEKIEKKLNDRGSSKALGSYKIMDTSGIVKALGTVLNTITTFVAIVASISLFIAGIGVMNMVYTSVSERSLEIGIKRALGAKRKHIRREFLLEGIMITMSGGLIGYIFGMIFGFLGGLGLDINVHPSVFTITIAVSISVIVGLLSSLLPAKKAANQNTVDILK